MTSQEAIQGKKDELELRLRTTLTGVISELNVTTDEGAPVKLTIDAFL